MHHKQKLPQLAEDRGFDNAVPTREYVDSIPSPKEMIDDARILASETMKLMAEALIDDACQSHTEVLVVQNTI